MKKILLLLLLISCLFLTAGIKASATGGQINAVEPDGLECTSAGIAYIPSTDAYGEWSWEWYKGADANNFGVGIISSANDELLSGYSITFHDGESIRCYRYDGSGYDGTLFKSNASYLSINTWYKIKVVRTVGNVFTTYISGDSFGSGWTIADDSNSGSNPFTDANFTTSSYFAISVDAGDQIRNVKINGELKHISEATVSSGAFTPTGTVANRIKAYTP
jgi:hypothetical protein